MNLRQLSNTIQRLDNSPIPEVASVAESLLAAARLRHPHSFKNVVNGMNKDQNSRVLQEALLRDPPPFSESFPKYTGKIGEFTIPVPSAGSADLELYYPCVLTGAAIETSNGTTASTRTFLVSPPRWVSRIGISRDYQSNFKQKPGTW